MKSVHESNWKEVGHSIFLCELPLLPNDLEKSHGIEFFEYEEPGLGKIQASVVKSNESVYWFYWPKGAYSLGVCVEIGSLEPNKKAALECLLNDLGLGVNDLKEVNSEI